MNARLIAYWRLVRDSYWFIPSLMSLLAIFISTAFIQVDLLVPDDWIASVDWLYDNEPEGARLLLSTIAGSMIGIAGITFSVTIAAVAFASGQFGPRILTNFMRDRSNQVTLGVFVSTFMYCLLVLRTIQSNSDDAFVPHFSVLFGVLLALASIGVLIHFIHHIADSIHVTSAMSRVGNELIASVETVFPEQIGTGSPPEGMPTDEIAILRERFEDENAIRVLAVKAGYVQAISGGRLLEIARDRDLIIRLEYHPGDFTAVGRTLMRAIPSGTSSANISSESVIADLSKTIAIGNHRTPDQDFRYLIEQLTDMAGRALSPGVNDPYTASSCLNWLGAAIGELSARDPISRFRSDADGNLRVIADPIDFETVCAEVFGSLRQYLETNRIAAERAMTIFHDVIGAISTHERRAIVVEYAHNLMDGVARNLSHPADVAEVRKRLAAIERTVARIEKHSS